jgi:predicted dinucleotide-binding enzyme
MSIRKVTIAGAGNVGSALARNLLRHGIDVQLAASDLASARQAATALGERAHAVELASLREGVDALFLAVPAAAAPAVLEAARGLPAGTIVVDCTNPLRWQDGPVHTPPPEGSTAAQLARQFPALHVLKAFNTFGAEFHDRPELGAAKADLYLAGDDADAKNAVTELARTLGYDPVDVGPLRNAAHLESLAILWIHLATVGKRGRDFAFKAVARGA